MSKQDEKKLIAKVWDGRSYRQPDLSKLISFGLEKAQGMVASYESFCDRYAGVTHYNDLRGILNVLGDYCAQDENDLSTPKALTDFFCGFRVYWYTTSNIKRQLFYRNSIWMVFRNYLSLCITDKVFPKFLIPAGNSKLNNKSKYRVFKESQLKQSETPIDEGSIVPIDLSRNDYEYLNILHERYKEAEQAFLNSSLKEIRHIERQYNKFHKLVSKKKWLKLRKKIARSKSLGYPFYEVVKTKDGFRKAHLFTQLHPRYESNILTYIQYKYDGICFGAARCGFFEVFDRELNIAFTETDYKNKIKQSDIDIFLGRITTRMLVPFFVYLLISFPHLRISSLLDAEVGGNSINSLLSSAGSSEDSMRISVGKNRGKTHQSSLIDDRTISIINLLCEITNNLRCYLNFKNSDIKNKLWVKVNGGDSYGQPGWVNTRSLRRCFGMNAKHLESDKLKRNERDVALNSFLYRHVELHPYLNIATLNKLPEIKAIIKWFETDGDINEVSDLLGNSKKVCQFHYVPYHIQFLMNVRTIRRFQNLLLCCSLGDKALIKEVTDFKSESQIHDFLSQMLVDHTIEDKTKNVVDLINVLSQRLGFILSQTNELNTDKKVLILIDEQLLSILFCYADFLSNSVRKEGAKLKLNAQSKMWIELSVDLHNYLKSSNANRVFKGIYKRAIILASKNKDNVSFPSPVFED